MNISAVVKQIYPEITENDFLVANYGNGPSIVEWNYAQPQPTAEELTAAELPAAKAQRRAWLNDYHAQNGLTVVEFTTSGGVTKLFDADPVAIGRIQGTLLAAGGTLPDGFYWVAADNTQVPFTFTDLQGLAATIFYHGWLSFNHLQNKKAEVDACLTIEEVESVNW